MRDSDEELRQALVEDVDEIEKRCEYPKGVAFQHWAAVHVLGIKDEEVHKTLKRTMGKDKGIDYFYMDNEMKTVQIIQAKFYKDLDSAASREDLSSFFGTINRLNNSEEGSEYFRTCQAQYRKAMINGFKTKLIFVITGSLTKENNDEVKVWEKSNSQSNVWFECLQTKDLLGLIDNPNSPSCELELCGNERFVGNVNNETKKIVATVSARELKKIHEKIGEYVFSENPRDFLGPKKISKAIKKTLQDSPERLWYYNNGISAVCRHFRYDEKTNALSIENLKIVNGCQTVTTIGLFDGVIEDDAALLFRLSEVDDEDFRNKISEYTNSQSTTLARDLNAYKKELRVLKYKFKKYPNFFWEQKRGQFDTLLRQKNKRSKPSYKKLYVIDTIAAGKLKLAYKLEKPHLSTKLNQEKIFRDEVISSNIHPFSSIYKDSDPQDFIVPRIFYYCLDKMRKVDDIKEQEQTLLSYDIGKYYVVAMIGKIIRSMPPKDQNKISEWVVKAATGQDECKIDMIIGKLENVVHAVASCLAYIRENNAKHVWDDKSTKNALEEEWVFKNLYETREAMRSSAYGKTDPVKDDLRELVGLHSKQS